MTPEETLNHAMNVAAAICMIRDLSVHENRGPTREELDELAAMGIDLAATVAALQAIALGGAR